MTHPNTDQGVTAEDIVTRLRALMEAATPGPYRAHDHNGMARVGANPADWIGYAWVGRITANSGPNGSFDAGWLSADRRKDGCKEYRERASADVHFVAEALNALPNLLDRLSSTATLEAEVKLVRQQIEYLTGVPSAPGVINDYRAPEIDAAVLRCRERGDDETAQILARMRLAYREQKDSLTSEIASLKQRLESAEGHIRDLACDLEAEIEARRGVELPRRIERDLDPVRRARTFLQEQEKQNG